MKIVDENIPLYKKAPATPQSRRKSYSSLIDQDFGEFDYCKAPPIYSGYMLYADIVNEYHLKKNHRGTLLQPPFLSMRFIVEGSQYVQCKGKLILAEPGDIMLIPPMCDYSYSTGPEGHCFQRSITMKGILLNVVLEHTGFSRDSYMHLEDPKFYLDMHNQLKALLKSDETDAREWNSAICFFLLQRLANLAVPEQRPEMLTQCQHFIEKHLDGKLGMNMLAAKFRCCPSTLNKLFRNYLNMPVHQYIIARRMERAGRMLHSQEYSVKEIAYRLGFGSTSNFSTEFKKYYGRSPRNFLHKDAAALT